MTCAVCSAPAPLTVHKFVVGDPARPSAMWAVAAPLYFASTPDFRRAVAGFCSAICSTAWHAANRNDPQSRVA